MLRCASGFTAFLGLLLNLIKQNIEFTEGGREVAATLCWIGSSGV